MKAILSFLVRAFVYTFSLLGDLFYAMIDAFEKQKGFNAKFGKASDIGGYFNSGFPISKNLRLSKRTSYQNLLVTGNSGSGKTSKILLPLIYSIKEASLIITDPSGELYNLASGYLSQYYKIRVINFSSSSLSSSFNILPKPGNPDEVYKLAFLLAKSNNNANSTADPFWELQTISTLEIFIELVLHQQEQYHNMANVLFVVQNFSANAKKVDSWIAKTRDEKLILSYKSLIAIPERTLSNIIATTKSALQIFNNPEIARITAFNSISFEKLRTEPTCIFLNNSIQSQAATRTISSIFFEKLYGHILQRLPDKKELDIYIILEECSSMLIPILPLALANGRKFRSGTVCSIQSHNQLRTLYKDEADNIIQNCGTHVYLPGLNSLETLQQIEALSGKCIYTDEKGIERVKPLLTVDEARLLPENRAIVYSGNNRVIKSRISPFYKSYKYRAYSKIPPPPLKGDIPDGPILLMQ